MKCAETTVRDKRETSQPEPEPACKGIIHFPSGLLGFEDIKKYVLIGTPDDAPFMWLQMAEDPSLAFLVICPSLVVENYNPDISPEDAEFLGLQSPQEALVLNIVTTHKEGSATVNLKGPIVVNRYTLIGKQLIPLNSADYSVQYPLAVVNR
jgi:flagellar assembly factor FliW